MSPLLGSSLSFLLAAILLACVHAYKIGDTVDGIAWTGQEFISMKRTEMPLFGRSSVATFERRKGLLSFGFEDGLHMVPLPIDIDDVERLVVKFIFSKGGQGAIESVSISTTRGPSSQDDMIVEYQWVEEIPASPQEGACAMFLGSLIACVAVLFQVCITSDSEEMPTETDHSARGHKD